ncbi:MAG: family 10 glycosylhydrolase [Taibaiella sp.]|nr:family 10 glycosylhydrolase [Taibaiella sp.]
MLRSIALIIFLLLSLSILRAQPPKREFRAAWIATVGNIDWPSKQGLPSVEQQQQFISRLDQLKAIGCNVVIVQIRPSADAFYASQIEPWSHYLTGRQGTPPFPYYDPLTFMITETHKRNMEFHAWFNPFRALVDSKKNPNPPSHVTFQHPDWIISYGGKSYIDPGMWPARDYVISVISDVVKRYDIDAVHLDDYFYPYRIAGQDFGDYRSYAKYGQGQNKEDWRRGNVSFFIKALNENIKRIKPYMKLGVSPFGVWRNQSKDPEGSATHGGQTDYDDLYADVVLWMRNGWVDYLLPQIYWEHNNHAAPFNVLLPWWNAHRYGRGVYYGLGVYRMVGARNGPWAGTSELLSQVRDIRRYRDAGYAFYSTVSFDKVTPAIRDSLHKYCIYPALLPAMRWIDSIPPAAPVLKAIPSSQGTLLQWQQVNILKEPLRYVVYRFVNDEPVNTERADRILAITQGSEYLDATANRYQKCTYIVTATDRTWNESRSSNEAVTHL